MEEIVNLHVRLHSGDNGGEPLTGPNYKVRFYDRDLMQDDFLGESTLDAQGHAIVSIVKSDYRSGDSPLERYPDVYFRVMENDRVVYKSEVFKDLDVAEASDFAASEGRNLDLGTFII